MEIENLIKRHENWASTEKFALNKVDCTCNKLILLKNLKWKKVKISINK